MAKQIRLDKFLSNSNFGTRKHTKKMIKNGLVTLNDKVIKVPDLCFDPSSTTVKVDGEEVKYFNHIYLMINKPKNYLCSVLDEEGYESVLNLLDPIYQKRAKLVGRLDVDTTGLLLLTDDGKLNNRLIHPHHMIEKEYEVTLNHEVPISLVEEFNKPIDIGQGEIASPSTLKDLEGNKCHIILKEGKYHEIKRLFKVFHLEVVELKRVRLSFLTLGNLKLGKCRELDEEEIMKLKDITGLIEDEDEYNGSIL